MEFPRRLEGLRELLAQGQGVLEVGGVRPVSLAWLLASLSLERPLLVLFPREDVARQFVRAFFFFVGESPEFFPAPEAPPLVEVLPSREIGVQRVAVLAKLLLQRARLVVATPVALQRRTVPPEALRGAYEYLLAGEEIPRERLLEKLVALGYERVGRVEGPGEFAVRGGVIDLWPPGYEDPLRLDFFGDQLESIRVFDPQTQRGRRSLEEAYLFPVREIFLTGDPESLSERILQRAERYRVPSSEVEDYREALILKRFLRPEEFWLPLLFEKLTDFRAYLPRETGLVLWEPERIRAEAEGFWERVLSGARRLKRRLLFEPEEVFLSPEEWERLLEKSFEARVLARELPLSGRGIALSLRSPEELLPPAEGRGLSRGLALIRAGLESGDHLVLVLSSRTSAERLGNLLREEGLTEDSPPVREGPLRELDRRHPLELYIGDLPEGFWWPELALILLSETELWGRRPPGVPRRPRVPGTRLEDLKPGDYVVHREHGIGLYQGLVRLEVGGVPGEFLLVEYAGGDRLYLPVDRLGEIHRYVGVDERPPPLDRLGGKGFARRKEKVKRAVQEIAQELVALYAARRVARGHAFSPPDLVFREFEASFPYEETPDQEAALEEILADMQSPRPMDRLLAGDVGYGKTEVALRAAMLAVRDGKQVAVLVPTTVLAEQHYRTFRERMEPFGIRVGILSRLRPLSEQRETLKALARGEIQVVIGTHRLLSTDVRFKDLGLLIIDEEHRFGVRQKERLKELKKTVDVLSLSATPIPRTLQMSLLGIRDLSVIETPPPGRLPVKTILAKMEPEIVKEAIRRELSRGGQVFFVYPRVRGLSAMAGWVRRLVPEARVAMAHGQMPARELEEVMSRFVRREIEVLVCTTIIESGLDIPSANTIIICRADRLGLAEIYQLRGRVGRGNVQAYAYLLVPSLSGLTEEARKRLQALMQFTELGSGFRLALSDLKIRGAGNLLGTSQSGHIAAVGYDLYLEILERAVRELRGEKIEERPEPEVRLNLPAYFPETYVPDVEERLHLYRELSLVQDEEALVRFEEDLKDRFGEPPPEGRNLLELTRLKLLLRTLWILKLESRGQELIFHLGRDPAYYQKGIRALFPVFRQVRLTREGRLRVRAEGPLLSQALKIGHILREKILQVREGT